MGLNYREVRELLDARAQGASFERTLTIGRQTVCIHRAERKLLPIEPPPFEGYGDEFLTRLLDIRELHALDASDFEGAEIVHDLNQRLGVEEEYDAVIDGGTLEHVFNTPVALANYMRALKVGGTLFISTPANNLLGHGFYQFSPELMYRALSEQTGFKVERMLLVESRYPSVELSRGKRVLEAIDPAVVGKRGLLLSRRPGMLHVLATKTRHLDEPFAEAPQQSDYQARWVQGETSRVSALARRAPKWLLGLRQRIIYSPRRSRLFRRV